MSPNRRGNVPPATVMSVSQTDDMPDSPPGVFAPGTKRERATDIAPDATGEAEGRMGDGSVPENELDDHWMQALAKTPTGRHVRDYLAHVASACSVQDPGIECPIDQVTSYRRALIRALEMSEQPFGLPRKLPRFIFVANLCGRKLLLTSARSVLLQLMSHSPNGAGCVQQAMLGIKAVMRHMDANPDDSVLMTYSMPFQVEMSNLFWDVRTIRRMPNGRILDGQISYQLGGGQARAVASTSGLEHESSRGELDAIIEGFRANMACVDMDINVGGLPSAESTDSAQQGRVAHLEQMVNMLQHERKKMHVDHRQEIDAARERVQQAVEAAQAASAEAYAQERTDEKVLADQLGILKLEFDKTKEAFGRKDIELKKLKAKSAAADLEWDGELKDMQSKTALMEASCNQAAKQLAKSNSERDKTLKRQETQHAQTLDEMERRYQSVVLSERAARAEGESLMERMVTLSKTMEGHDATDEAYRSELAHLKRANKVLGGLVQLGGCRFDCALEFAKQYPVAIARAEEAEGALKVAKLASASARADAGRLQADVDSLKEAEASNAKCSAPVIEPPAMTDAATMTQPITSKAELELGEIQTAHCKLQDEMKAKERELAETKAEFARVVKRSAKKNPPPDCLTEQPPSASAVVGHPTQPQMAGGAYMINNHVHIGNGGNGIAPVPIDLGVDPNADPSVEHAIAQAVGTLRYLADMARESSRHKAAATEGWATVRALQQYSAYAPPPPALQGPVGMMYHGQHMAQGGFVPGHSP